MNRQDAKKIAETITNKQLLAMLQKAMHPLDGVKDWTQVSSCNKGISKGVAWNVLAKTFSVNKELRMLYKINLIREFGDFLPDSLKPPKRTHKKVGDVVHQKPDFLTFKQINGL